jgi:hypothetical protein
MTADSINAVWLQHKSDLSGLLLHRTPNEKDYARQFALSLLIRLV